MAYRRPEYLSPSAISIFVYCPEAYFLRYMHPTPPPREPQTKAMAIGSAFDAYIKSHLYEAIRGKPSLAGNDLAYERDTLFEAQVEPHNRQWGREEAEFLFGYYQSCGALANLMVELETAVSEPKFEVEIRGEVMGRRQHVGPQAIEGVELYESEYGLPVLLGKPDLYFINRGGVRVVLDWKVNGYVAEKTKSPEPGYTRICQLVKMANLQTGKSDYVPKQPERYKTCIVKEMGGMQVSISHTLDAVSPSWAEQISIYAWLLGTPVGESFISAIDQICGPSHNLRIASHRNTVTGDAQYKYYNRAVDLWHRCQSGHLWRELPREASDAKCQAIIDNPGPTLELCKLPFYGFYSRQKEAASGNLLDKIMTGKATID